MRKRQVRTMLQSVILERHSDNLPVMKARQRSAFPPNFIHSVDSSHMMLTALACAEEGARQILCPAWSNAAWSPALLRRAVCRRACQT